MSKAVQLHIPEPCHENWHNMTPSEQGRYCGSCQKIVVDFSAMSDKEILDYISSASTHLCGRFSNDQLNREIKVTENKRRFSWAYVWNVLLATFLFTESYAQGEPAIKKKPVTNNKPVKPKKPAPPPNLFPTMGTIAVVVPDELPPPREINGAVLDKTTNEPLQGASVYFKDQSKFAVTDSIGHFNIPVTNEDSVILMISYVGYEPQTLVLNNTTNWQDIKVHMNRAHLGEMVFVGGITVNHKIKRKEKIKRTVNSWMPATLKKDIRVYPNPVVRGNAIQATVSLKQTNSYKLELIDVQGRVVEVQKLVITTNKQQVAIPTQTDWSAGIYWIRITAPGIKDVYQAKVSIQ